MSLYQVTATHRRLLACLSEGLDGYTTASVMGISHQAVYAMARTLQSCGLAKCVDKEISPTLDGMLLSLDVKINHKQFTPEQTYWAANEWASSIPASDWPLDSVSAMNQFHYWCIDTYKRVPVWPRKSGRRTIKQLVEGLGVSPNAHRCERCRARKYILHYNHTPLTNRFVCGQCKALNK